MTELEIVFSINAGNVNFQRLNDAYHRVLENLEINGSQINQNVSYGRRR